VCVCVCVHMCLRVRVDVYTLADVPSYRDPSGLQTNGYTKREMMFVGNNIYMNAHTHTYTYTHARTQVYTKSCIVSRS